MVEKENLVRTRREVLIKAGMALLALVTRGIGPRDFNGAPSEDYASNKGRSTADKTLSQRTPSPADAARLHEQLSYLSELPTGARVFDAVSAIREFLGLLDDHDLPSTCIAARPLRGLNCHYGIGSTVLSEQSKQLLAETVIPIHRVLEIEI